MQVRTPKSFRFEPELRGGHVHVTVRAGQEGQRARLGVLIMDEDDWGELAALIQRGADWAELAGELAAVFGAAILPSGAAAPRWGPPVVDKLVEES
ncbi:MAG: hypothetical protein ACRDXE_10515 [Acidimicrobiales bacterium]